MACVFMHGLDRIDALESGSTITYFGSGGRTGGYARITPSSSTSCFIILSSPFAGGKYAQIYIRPISLPSTARVLIGGDTSADHILWNTDGTLSVRVGVTLAVIGTSTTALNDINRWYRIGWRVDAATSVPQLVIDGVSEVTGTLPTGISPVFGDSGGGVGVYDVDIDDYSIDDTAFPGDNKIVLLVPISDNARNGWTGGVGGTTNLFDAVNNIPPIGTATETDLTQIESATNSATDNCDINVQSYTTGGVGASDQVNAVMAVTVHGEDINTGTKNGAVTIVSNPAQSGETTFTYGNDGGALGTWTIGWITTYGAVQNSPSVTKGTSPVVRVGKRTATTRVVSCCFLGLYVNYTPAVAATFSFPFARRDCKIVSLI